MCRSIYTRHNRLDVLVNNAGVAHAGLSLLVPFGAAREVIETNFLGAMLVAREAAKIMQRQRYGRIISIGSIAPVLRIEGEAVYAASKSALTTFCQVFAREIAPLGITCNVVASTPIPTDLIGSIPQEMIDDIVGRLAVKRLGTFEDVINVVEFFADRKSDYITGQVIHLGGV
jgi:3-oxoacyl-[acyl-carrier protein] reductase